MLRLSSRSSHAPRLAFALLLVSGLGACTTMEGQREAYLHSRQIIVEMDPATAEQPVTRMAAWPGPEFNLTLVRGDSPFAGQFAQADSEAGPTPAAP